jgi:uncharacterized protein with FMN-binding domain
MLWSYTTLEIGQEAAKYCRVERITIMSTQKSSRAANSSRVWRKALVSGFVLASYLAYAIHDRFAAPAQGVAALPQAPQPGAGASASPQGQAAPGASAPRLAAPVTAPDVTVGSQYKNGTFTGVAANAFYGQVQVQVVINNGKISSVNFLDYPQDRRTSARINSFAVPYLQSEAIQAQSAQVDVVSGATLTSEAFMVSLQSALANAHS